jgi:ubiquinone biosynthesis protein
VTEQPSRRLVARRALALLWTATRFGVPFLLRWLLRMRGGREDLPARVRIVLEDLGLTYVKLGQYLAMRFDILPADVCRELGKLFDEVAPMSPEQARAVLDAELRAPTEELFLEFSAEPMAAASVAQVHRARTRAGQAVAVKVQRPGIERVFRADIAVQRFLTRTLDAFHVLGRLSATEMLDQFAKWTLREVDFEKEGRTAERVGQNREPYEVEPGVHWDLTTSRVLTLDFIEGTTLAQIVRIIEEGGQERLAQLHPSFDVDLILHHMTFASLRQIFVTGLFHGDPHPGNIIVLDDNRVAFVDFGIFGDLTGSDREMLGAMIEQLAVGNVDESLREYTRQLTVTADSDVRGFRAEARAVLQEWHDTSLRADTPVAARHLGKYIGQMIDISRRYRLLYDMSFLLYWRALNALDSTALRMSGTFDLMAELREFFEQIRPGVFERLAAVTVDQRRLLVVRRLQAQLRDRAAAALDDTAAGRAKSTVVAGEDRASRRARHREARWTAAAAVSVSLWIVATLGEAAGAVAVAALVLGAAAGTLSLFRLGPR